VQFSFVLCNVKETCGVCAFSLAWIFASGPLDELYQSLSLTHCFETILNQQAVVCINTQQVQNRGNVINKIVYIRVR